MSKPIDTPRWIVRLLALNDVSLPLDGPIDRRFTTRIKRMPDQDEVAQFRSDRRVATKPADEAALAELRAEATAAVGLDGSDPKIMAWGGKMLVLFDELDANRAKLAEAEWRPIESEKPPRHQTVEFLCSNGDVYQGRPCYGMHEPYWCGHGELNFGVVLADKGLEVTHWREQRPLPSPPKDPAK